MLDIRKCYNIKSASQAIAYISIIDILYQIFIIITILLYLILVKIEYLFHYQLMELTVFKISWIEI